MKVGERIIECCECGEPFGVSGGRTGPMIDWEDIICPYCKAKNGGDRIADVFSARKLTAAEIAAYEASKKR